MNEREKPETMPNEERKKLVPRKEWIIPVDMSTHKSLNDMEVSLEPYLNISKYEGVFYPHALYVRRILKTIFDTDIELLNNGFEIITHLEKKQILKDIEDFLDFNAYEVTRELTCSFVYEHILNCADDCERADFDAPCNVLCLDDRKNTTWNIIIQTPVKNTPNIIRKIAIDKFRKETGQVEEDE